MPHRTSSYDWLSMSHRRQRIERSPSVAYPALIGYVMGNFPSADLASRISGAGTRIRTSGSGNPGATNAAKVLGRAWGSAVLAVDVAKGAGATSIGSAIAGQPGAFAAGLGSVIGHSYPIGRGGGKGVATRYGALVAVVPAQVIFELAVAAVALRISRRPLVAMAVSTFVASAAGVTALRHRSCRNNVAGITLGAASAVVVLLRFIQDRPAALADPVHQIGPGPRAPIS